MELKEIKEFIESPQGEFIREYLETARKSFLSIERINMKDTVEQQKAEFEASRKAIQYLDEILGGIMYYKRLQMPQENKPEEDSLVPGIEK